MARRTKEEALATRHALLDAAEHEFDVNGVSGTSLARIAAAAGLTRGAVYWHFQNKADLFNAMMDRAILPFEQLRRQVDDRADVDDALHRVRELLLVVLKETATRPSLQRVFAIATHKVEYVGELNGVADRHRQVRGDVLKTLERSLRLASRRCPQSSRFSARDAAVGLHALVDGLIYNWMLDRNAFDLVRVGRKAVDSFIAGLAAAGCSDQAG